MVYFYEYSEESLALKYGDDHPSTYFMIEHQPDREHGNPLKPDRRRISANFPFPKMSTPFHLSPLSRFGFLKRMQCQ